jgi:transcriptional regulator with XRE-family HTH domain
MRERRHLTQEQLAKKTGIAQNTISKYETNRHANPGWSRVLALAAALDVDPTRLRFGLDPRQKRRPASAAVPPPKAEATV